MGSNIVEAQCHVVDHNILLQDNKLTILLGEGTERGYKLGVPDPISSYEAPSLTRAGTRWTPDLESAEKLDLTHITKRVPNYGHVQRRHVDHYPILRYYISKGLIFIPSNS